MESFIQNLFADRIGGKTFGKDDAIYKFEKIKRAKESAKSKFPETELIDMGVGEPDEMADEMAINILNTQARIHENRGYAGVSLLYSKEEYPKSKVYLKGIEQEINETISSSNMDSKDNSSKKSFEAIPGIKIFPKNSEDLKKQVRNSRKKTDVLMVVGGDLKINRTACENIKLDVLSRPYYKRRDCGINHVLAKEAAKNQVTIELNICDILRAKSHIKSKIMTHFQEIIKLQRKFKFPLIITSGAISNYDLRNPRDLIAFSQCFGLNKNEAKLCISHNPMAMIDFNRHRSEIIVIGAKKICNI